jgi:hypothetical protein
MNALMPRTILTAIVTGAFLSSGAGTVRAETDIDPLFASNDVLDVVIKAPFSMLSDERPDEEEAKGTFSYTGNNGELVEFDIQIRTRGRLRRGKKTCAFPPFRLNFKKSQVKDSLFHKQDKLKLVSHCRPNADPYEQAVIAEYLVYRIYNLLTDRSFHARLLNATYVYTDETREENSYAILIEHKDRLEKRLDAKTIRSTRVGVRSIAPEDLNLASVFQYFIGNTDFSPVASALGEDCCHNQVLLTRGPELSYTVPYDFDQSGMVNAPYAAPNSRFRMTSVRERRYRGRCVNNDHLPATLDLFRERRDEIEALIKNQEGLDTRARRSMLEFVAEFYRTIDSPRRLNRRIVEACLN